MARDLPVYTVAELEPLVTLEFPSLTNDEAVTLGLTAVSVIRERGLNLAVDIVIGDDLVFRARLGSTGPWNDQWLVGKAATAMRFGEPSLLVKLRHVEAGTEFTDEDVDHDLLKAHGGAIPLRVGGAIVGTLTMSGEPDVIDHETAVAAIERYLDTVRR